MNAFQDGFSWNYYSWAYDVAKLKTLEKLKFYKKRFCLTIAFSQYHTLYLFICIYSFMKVRMVTTTVKRQIHGSEKSILFHRQQLLHSLTYKQGIILSNVCVWVWVWFFWKGEMYGMNLELMYYWWRCIPYCKDINLGIVMYLTIYIFYVHKNKFTNAHSYSLTHTYTSKCKYLPFVQPRETTINATNF